MPWQDGDFGGKDFFPVHYIYFDCSPEKKQNIMNTCKFDGKRIKFQEAECICKHLSLNFDSL